MEDLDVRVQAAVLIARRFYRHLANDAADAVGAMLHPTYGDPVLLTHGGEWPPALCRGIADQMHLSFDDCRAMADEFAERQLGGTTPDPASGQFSHWMRAPDGRRVSLTMFLERGSWWVFPAIPVPFAGEDLDSPTIPVTFVLPPED